MDEQDIDVKIHSTETAHKMLATAHGTDTSTIDRSPQHN